MHFNSILLVVFCLTNYVSASNDTKILSYLNKKMPVAAAIFTKEKIKNGRKDSTYDVLTEQVIQEAGPIIFNNLDLNNLKNMKTETFNFLIGVKFYENRNWKVALEFLNKVKLGHRYYAEAQLFAGSALLEMEEVEKASVTFFNCSVIADDMMNKEKQDKVLNYLSIIKDQCLLNYARVKYEQADYKKAIDIYNQISKTSFLWPYTLIEKAWAFYQLEDYNRTLGLLVTYKSPLLESYFFAENELLAAMAYNRLCLWDDALVVTNNYQTVFKEQSEVLKNVLNSNKNSKSFFYDLYMSNNNELQKYRFVKNIKTHLSKKIRLNLNILLLEKINKEIEFINNNSGDFSSEDKKFLLTSFNEEIQNIKSNINHLVKAYFFDYINKIHQLSFDMFNINLDILSDKRNLMYVGKNLESNRARGDFKNVKREVNEYFFSFDGPFWADELGDYSFGLQTNCHLTEQQAAI